MANQQHDPAEPQPNPNPPPASAPPAPDAETPARKPAWAKDLRSLYDSVVEEPLPDSFMDLLARLDEDGEGGDGGPESAGPA